LKLTGAGTACVCLFLILFLPSGVVPSVARLAYVFEIYDESLKENEEFEDFVEIVLKSVRVKQTIQKHTTTLEEVAGLLYLIDNAKKISLIIGEIDEEEMENLMSFVKMFEKKVGIFSKTPLIDIEFYGI
jgi:hypothetical protein